MPVLFLRQNKNITNEVVPYHEPPEAKQQPEL